MMKLSTSGTITIPKELRDQFGLTSDSELDIQVTKEGLLLKPMSSHREQVNQWFKDRHGDEMATLTTSQIMQLIQ